MYVHNHYNDQLSVNTRAFLSLCAQAGTTGQMVVKPFIRQTKIGSDKSWLPSNTYYNTEYLDGLLETSGYAKHVEKTEYIQECPLNCSDHVSIHFIDNSTASMGFTTSNLRLKETFYKAIVANTSQSGWTKCGFLDTTMKRTPGKQFCVNGDIVRLESVTK